jgi:hypothetical protein
MCNKVKLHTAHAQLQLITASERQYFLPRSHFPLRYKRVLLLHLYLVDNHCPKPCHNSLGPVYEFVCDSFRQVISTVLG